MKANKLTDADIIFVGQTLVIPASGAQGLETVIPVATPSTTVTTSLLTATAAVLPASTAIVEIDEIIYPGDLARETVIIVNRGNRARKLSGWTLTAPDGGHYTFPNYNLWPGSSVRVHSVAGTDTITDLFWGRSVPAWSGRDRGAVLRDNTGRIIYEYP
ncbi:MAG TPA: lamin tail domain-containing protein [Anaerolineae bacterium]|nr:lamin tail domain-containing protein [Anaerolineae bacterium]